MKQRIETAIETVGTKLKNLDFTHQTTYETWLSQAYYFVKHSTPMLALSAGLSVNDRDYHIRCIDHLSEEKGHDKMLINDLKFLGTTFSAYPELASTQALYQTQYYWIQHMSPKSFLGYIFLLEGLAVTCGMQILEKVSKFKGNSFLKNHSEDDVDHLAKAFEVFDKMTETEQKMIVENCELAANLYMTMLEEITSYAASRTQQLPQFRSEHRESAQLT